MGGGFQGSCMTLTCSRLCPAQGLQGAIAEHKPLMGKLWRITMRLAELGPWKEAPLWQRLQAAEEWYGSLQEQAQEATAMLRKAIPRYSQVSQDHHQPVAVSICTKAHSWERDGSSLLAQELLDSDCCLQGTPCLGVAPSFPPCLKKSP